MRELLVIGIGTGHPDHVTVQAVAALNRVDVVFLLDKGTETAPLRDLRRAICARHVKDRTVRFVEAIDVNVIARPSITRPLSRHGTMSESGCLKP